MARAQPATLDPTLRDGRATGVERLDAQFGDPVRADQAPIARASEEQLDQAARIKPLGLMARHGWFGE